jgi:hypothetical protein
VGRRCRIYGIDPRATILDAATHWCDRLLVADPRAASLESWLRKDVVDAVLWLENAAVPAEPVVLRRLINVLRPGGRLITSQPVSDILRLSGWRTVDQIRLPRAAVLIAEAGEDVLLGPCPALASSALNRLGERDAECQRLRQAERELRDEVQSLTIARSQLLAALEEARTRQGRSLEAVGPLREALHERELEVAGLKEELTAAAADLAQCRIERRFLSDDLGIKDAYIATLRETVVRLEQTAIPPADESAAVEEIRRVASEEQRVLNERLNALGAAESAALARVADLDRSNGELRQQLDAAHAELQRVHAAVAATLAQPRYVLADRLNGWMRKLSMLHAPLKRALLRTRR